MTSFLEGIGAALVAGFAGEDPRDLRPDPARVAAAIPLPVTLVHLTPGFVESRHVLAFYVDRRARVVSVAKTPRRSWDGDTVRREAASLRRLVELAPQLRESVPDVLACVTADARPVMLQVALDGAPLTHARLRRDLRSADAVQEWISTLPVTGSSTGAAVVDELLEPTLRRLEAMLPRDHDLRDVVRATREVLSRLADVELPRVFEHGDPSHPNLLVAGRRSAVRVGIVDWELAVEQGAVGHDLAQFLAFRAFALAGAHGLRAESEAFETHFRDAGSPGRQRFAAGLPDSVPPDAAAPLFVLAWARAAVRILDRLAPEDAETAGSPAVPLPSDHLVELLSVSRNAVLWRAALSWETGPTVR